MGKEIKYYETGFCPYYDLQTTANDVPAKDTTNPNNGFLEITNDFLIVETKIEIVSTSWIENVAE